MSSNADRLFEREAHGIVGHGIYVADNFSGQAPVIFETSSDIVKIKFSFNNGLAGIAALEFGERGQVGANFFGETEEHTTALLRRCSRPRAFFESSFRGSNGTVHVVSRGIGDLGDDFFCGGIVDREGFCRFAVDPFTVDKHLIAANIFGYVGCDSAWHWFRPPGTAGAKARKLAALDGTTKVVP